ncbi:hypothetical protein AVEN_207093-1 [Araneus ventricosus]|uniref:Uncharacterized protein n=1 Tax=Araneus ventricosus TaxID=182803 RepID=A0A4Y2LNI0_ARAVE|nr:hypothetical protein AVEN_207093-1 [Araneus ventricosus]
MLLATLTGERCHIRTLAACRIIKAREIGPDGDCIRRFVIPAVNFRATDYVDLIDWQACNVTQNTFNRHITSHELLKMIQDDAPMDGWDLIKLPSKQLRELRNSSLKLPEKELDDRAGMDLSKLH